MKFVLLYNPNSGKAKGAESAAAIAAALGARAHEVSSVTTAEPELFELKLAGTDGAVLIGGDGTVNRSLACCERSSVPIYHFPMGNQNLFARECGHTADIPRTVALLESRRTRKLDLGILANTSDLSNPRRFAIMVSLGPDAAVIHRLSATRTAARGHFVYTLPILEEAWDAIRSPKPPVLRVWVDGKKVADDAGWLVVSNSRHFALRIDPGMSSAQGVDPTDGMLDVAFFPICSRIGILPWLVRCRLGGAGAHPAFVGGRGKEIVVEGVAPWQVDGEAGKTCKPGERLRFECRQGAITVFCLE